MDTLLNTLCTIPNAYDRLTYVENLVIENPADLAAWLYLADHYLHYDLQKTVYAWEQIASLRPADQRVADALQSAREVSAAVYQ